MVAVGYYCRTWVYSTMVRPNLNHPDDGGLCVWLIVRGVNAWLSGVIHNCLVKDEWRQIGLRMFRLCRVRFHGVHPWNEHVCFMRK